jgi:hypothetical protein
MMKNGFEIADKPYPRTASHFLPWSLSESQPEKSFSKLAVASANHSSPNVQNVRHEEG